MRGGRSSSTETSSTPLCLPTTSVLAPACCLYLSEPPSLTPASVLFHPSATLPPCPRSTDIATDRRRSTPLFLPSRQIPQPQRPRLNLLPPRSPKPRNPRPPRSWIVVPLRRLSAVDFLPGEGVDDAWGVQSGRGERFWSTCYDAWECVLAFLSCLSFSSSPLLLSLSCAALVKADENAFSWVGGWGG